MKPSVLVVEDDPVTALFFEGVLAGTGHAVALAVSGAEAVALAARGSHAAWLVDAHLPDGDALAWLPRLRAATGAAGTRTRAIAHTASRSQALHDRLRAGGYARVLAKPCTADALLACVAGIAPPCVREARAHWDDGAAARTTGNALCVATLRGRFLAELPGDVARVREAAARQDKRALADALHRLSASCAFVGAAALGEAVRDLQAAPADPAALRLFLAAARALR